MQSYFKDIDSVKTDLRKKSFSDSDLSNEESDFTPMRVDKLKKEGNDLSKSMKMATEIGVEKYDLIKGRMSKMEKKMRDYGSILEKSLSKMGGRKEGLGLIKKKYKKFSGQIKKFKQVYVEESQKLENLSKHVQQLT